MSERRPRRARAEVQRAIHEAVLDQARLMGYHEVTFEGVARRASVSKPVLYRRYRTRAAMVLDAISSQIDEVAAPAPQGSLRDDLLAWLTAARDRAAAFGAPFYRGLLGEADAEMLGELAALIDRAGGFLERHVIAPARERGELGQRPLAGRVIAVPLALLRDRVIFGSLDDKELRDLVDEVAIPLFVAAATPSDQ